MNPVYNLLESMALGKVIERDTRLDDPSFSAVQRADQFRAQYDHSLVIPETLVLSLYQEPIIHQTFGIRTPDRLSLAHYLKNTRADEARQVGPGMIWDEEVENAIRQALSKTSRTVSVTNFYSYLILTDAMIDFRFSQNANTPVEVVEENLKSKRRVYSF